MSDLDQDLRELRKWLNEEPDRPIDRQALARVLAAKAAPQMYLKCLDCGSSVIESTPILFQAKAKE